MARPFSVGLEAGDRGVPAVGQPALLHHLDLGGQAGVRGGVGGEPLLPGGAGLGAARADPLGEVLAHPVGDEELGVLGPAVGALGLAHLLLAERFAVGGRGVLLVRRAPADVAVDDDQRRPALLGLELLEGGGEQRRCRWRRRPGRRSSRSPEAGGDVVVVGEVGFAVDRDVVVVVDPAEVVELEVAGERGGFVGDALHQAAVAGDRRRRRSRRARRRSGRRLPLGGDRHPDRGGDPLAERAGGRLDAGGPAVLGVAGGARVELAEVFDVVRARRPGSPTTS